MSLPVTITYRDMAPSPYVDDLVRRWSRRLERLSDRIHRCAIVIQRPHQHQASGQHFGVRLEVNVGDHLIVVSHDPDRDQAHQNVYVAIGDAFRAARRQLQDHVRIARGDVKLHA